MQQIHFLDVKPIVQKFFKPNSEDFTMFLDDSVPCPAKNNPFKTNNGNVPVSLVCFDCKSFKGFCKLDDNQKNLFCEGKFEIVVDKKPSVRDYLEPIEQESELFWNRQQPNQH